MTRPASLVRTAQDGTRFLGPYLLEECIGRGGTAILYRARRTGAAGFEKQVVVKTILPELTGDPRFVALFQEEAKLQAQLFHANIAQVQDFGVMRGTPFLELEVLSGWNTRQIFERLFERHRKMPARIAQLILTEVCRGLAYAHAFVEKGRLRPIIHRDISLANVMVCQDGAVKLIDFGLASVTEGGQLSIETFAGKLAYMSPEQLEGRIDRSADVFALGVVLWELLTGRRMFAADSDGETVLRVRTLEIKPPSKYNDEVSRAFDAVVMKAVSRDPAQRYASAGELLNALEGLRKAPATRAELLGYLGDLAPEVYASACDACGEPVPYGRSCRSCCTTIDSVDAIEAVMMAPVRALELVRTPPGGQAIALPLTPRARFERALASILAVAGTGIDRFVAGVRRLTMPAPLRY
jgi:serine/threonine protein kinase